MNFLCDDSMRIKNVGKFLDAGTLACELVQALTCKGTEPLDDTDRCAKTLLANIEKAKL